MPASVRVDLKDSIGKGLVAARNLTGEAQADIIELARSAFVEAMRPVYFIAAAVVLGAASVAWRYLPAEAATPTDSEVDVPETISVTDA